MSNLVENAGALGRARFVGIGVRSRFITAGKVDPIDLAWRLTVVSTRLHSDKSELEALLSVCESVASILDAVATDDHQRDEVRLLAVAIDKARARLQRAQEGSLWES